MTKKLAHFAHTFDILEPLFWVVMRWLVSRLLDSAFNWFNNWMAPFKKRFRGILKRALDFILAFLILLIIAPLFITLSMLIMITSGGPIFLRQVVVGHQGCIFTLYRFRAIKTTRRGHIMSKSGLNDLPMFINVLKGDMTFVGPPPFALR
jgi:lipopolysaccharide/colanic/teichoic acid biosynthesis glycosyltransferase